MGFTPLVYAISAYFLLIFSRFIRLYRDLGHLLFVAFSSKKPLKKASALFHLIFCTFKLLSMISLERLCHLFSLFNNLFSFLFNDLARFFSFLGAIVKPITEPIAPPRITPIMSLSSFVVIFYPSPCEININRNPHMLQLLSIS